MTVATRPESITRLPRTYTRYRARFNRENAEDIATTLFKKRDSAMKAIVQELVDQKIVVVEPVQVRRKQDVRFEEVER